MYLITATGDQVYTPVAVVDDLADALDTAENLAGNIWLARLATISQDDRFDPGSYQTVRVTDFRPESPPRVFRTFNVSQSAIASDPCSTAAYAFS